mgnify:FL=1
MMTDINKYRNVSLKHDTYSKVQRLSRQLIPQVNLSIAKTIQIIVEQRLNNERKSNDKG